MGRSPRFWLRPACSLGHMAAPVQRGEEVELEIDRLAYGDKGTAGAGVARLDGFVVFVRRGLPGDTVRARVTKVQRRHAEADAIEVVDAGPQHVAAPCQHFPTCGGCRFQDLAYEAQAPGRRRGAGRARLFRGGGGCVSGFPPWGGGAAERGGGVAAPPPRPAGTAEPLVEPIAPAADVFHYRNKMEYSFAPGPDGPE